MAKKAKHITRGLLSSDEHVVFESRPSALKYMISATIAILIGLLALTVFLWQYLPGEPEFPYIQEYMDGEYGQYIEWAALGIFVLSLLYFFIKWFRWGSTIYAVTDERLITQKGILNKSYDDIPLGMITKVDISQSVGKRILRYGTIYFSTQSTQGRKDSVVWEAVPNPLGVRRKLQEVMDIRVKPKE
ncbi:MAG: PH domain-containing protein [Thermoplasmata archaeon]|nr:PH domain-containing protein [Thermoplasmata archaeon]MCJ7561457.1 PH domain-containing protein [Thermoplasmata archaeon]TFG70504.1 MAG: PH domain-containing protein [Methanomassiliicoccus sp.]